MDENSETDFHVYLKCSDALLEVFEPYLEKMGAKVIRIADSLPLDFFDNRHSVIWETGKDDSPGLNDFLVHLRDSHRRDVLFGPASTLPDQLDNVRPTKMLEAVQTPEASQTQAILQTKKVSLITSLENPKEFVQLFNTLGYECFIDDIPINRKQVEAADLVVLIPNKEMYSKYEKAFVVFKDRLKKTAYFLSSDDPMKELKKHFSETGLLPGWIGEESNDLFNQPQLTEMIQSYAQLLFNLNEIEEQFAALKKIIPPETDVSRSAGSLKTWVTRACSFKYLDDNIKPWLHRIKRLEKKNEEVENEYPQEPQDFEKLTGLATAYSTVIAELKENRLKILDECRSILKKESFLNTWELVQKNTLEIYAFLYFREALLPLIKAAHEKLKGLVKPEGPQGWLPKAEEKADYKRELAQFEEVDNLHRNRVLVYERERSLLSDQLVDRYWLLYEELAIYWANDQKAVRKIPQFKLFLRTGFIGSELLKFSEEQKQLLNRVMETPGDEWEFGADDRHFLFVDDFLEKIAEGVLGTSVDENLELLHRGTDVWRSSRQFRLRATIYRTQNATKHLTERVKNDILVLRQEIVQLEMKLEVLTVSKKKRSKIATKGDTLAKDLRTLKARRARLHEHLEKCEKMITAVPLSATTVADKPLPEEEELNENLLRELKLMRKTTRLCNRLNEYFVPDTLLRELRNNYDKFYVKENLEPSLKALEELDCTLFEKTFVPHPKRSNRLVGKISPTFLILPGSARAGFCMEGSDEILEGRIAVPMIMKNNMNQAGNLLDLISDFRWDSCMNEVGSDWSSSDSIVGHYSMCRWNSRKHDADIREKSLIYKDETDKKNFRRHYQLYVKSAKQQGRLLFYKNKHIYEALNRHIPLPEGIEVLRP
jgi:chaperonin cofactor prefoldin